MILPNDKLYIIVREDLTAGLQLSQSCHVAFSFSQDFPEITKEWIGNSNYIVILNCLNEKELNNIAEQAQILKIKFSLFRDSDLNNELTAIALEPNNQSKKLCSNLKLALKGK